MRLRLTFIATVVALVLGPGAAFAAAPSPIALQNAAKDPAVAAQLADVAAKAHANGFDNPTTPRLVVRANAYGAQQVAVQSVPTAGGTWRTLAILVDFSDQHSTVAPSAFDSLLFGDLFGPASVRGYYREVSYGTPTSRGALDIVTVNMPSTLGWKRAPKTMAWYANNNFGLGTYPQNAQKLAEDAVALAAPYVDFSKYDNNGDGYVDNVFIVHAGPGAEVGGTDKSLIWSHKSQLPSQPVYNGVVVSDYTMEPEYLQTAGDMTTGVFDHELGHVFGLPDLYDTNYTSSGIGNWSLMAGGEWTHTAGGMIGDSPARFDPWCAKQLGWLTPQIVTAGSAVRSIPVASSAATAALEIFPGGGTSGQQYFMLENRQKTGTDTGLPGAGVLIYHIDESVPLSTANDNAAHKLVDIEEAEGPQGMDKNPPADDGGPEDPYPGTTVNRTFSNTTTPDAKRYDGTTSGVYVQDVSDNATTMTARVGFGTMVIDGGASSTATTTVTIDSDVSGASSMSVDAGSGFGPPIAFSVSKSAALPPGNGMKTVSVRYLDSSGATFATLSDTIVLGPGITSLTSPSHPVASTWYPSAAPSFTWAASDISGVAGYSWVLDTSAATTPDAAIDGATPSASFTGKADGVWYFHVRAVDALGNWGPPSHLVVRIDTTPPSATLTIASGAASTTTTVVPVQLTSTDISPVSMRISADAGSSWTSWVAAADTTTVVLPSGDGTKTVVGQFRDAAGNSSQASDTILLDTTGPGITSLASPSHPVASTWYPSSAPSFTWAASDISGVAGYSWVLDTSAATTPDAAIDGASASASFTGKADGVWYFHVRAVDALGNWGPPSHLAVRIDTTPPSATLTIAGGAASTTTTVVPVQLTSSDIAPVSMRISADAGSSWTSWVPAADTTTVVLPSGDGTKTVVGQFRDAAGNSSQASDTILLATAAPLASLTLAHGDSYVATTAVPVDLSIAGSGPFTVRFSVDGGSTWGSPGPYSNPSTVTVPAGDGLKTVVAQVTDAMARTGSATATITLDTTPPSATLTIAGGAASTTTTVVPVQLTSSDISPVSMRISADAGSSWTSWVAAADTTTVVLPSGDGTKTVVGQFRDAAGNSSQASDTILLDTTGPGITSLASPSHPVAATWYPSSAPSFTWAASDISGVAGYSWVLDTSAATTPDAAIDGASPSASFTGKADGVWYFHVRAADTLGNWGRASHLAVRIDTTPPSVTSDAAASYVSAAAVTITSSDGLSGVREVRYAVDGAAPVVVAGTTATAQVSAVGAHTLSFWAIDHAGNESAHSNAGFTVTAPAPTPPPAPPKVVPVLARIQGAGRYDVAANLARQGWDPSGDHSWPGVHHVIVASGEDRAAADPLAAAGLAGAYDAPILLVKSGTKSAVPAVTSQVIAEIAARNPGVVIHIVGGPASVADSTITKLLRISPSISRARDRLSGRDRYAVTVTIANRMFDVVGPTAIKGALIICSEKPAAFYDALSASPVSFAQHMPMIGVRTGGVPPEVAALLGARMAGKPRYAVSSATFISGGVVAATGASERLTTSADRFAAARSIAEASIAHGWSTPADTGVAAKLPDALTGGAFIGRKGGVLVFTDSTANLHAQTRAFFQDMSGRIARTWVLGGPASVTASTEAQLRAVLGL